MIRTSFLAACLFLAPAACFAQSASTDSQTLQALLAEVRLMRQDLRTTTIAAQRSQILIYRLQAQEASVVRASQRLNEVREKLARLQDDRNHVAGEVKQFEDVINNTQNPENERKAAEARLAELKMRLQFVESEEQQSQTQEIEAQQQLRAEEVRLNDLRDQLDRLDKSLENTSHKSDSSHQ